MPTVFCSRNIPHIVDQIQRRVPGIEIRTSRDANSSLPRDELLRQVDGCVGILCHGPDFVDAAVIDAAGPSLKVVSTMSVGFNHIDIEACKARGVRVGNTPGVLDVTTAETAVALTFAAKRRIVECVDSARQGGWGVWQPYRYCGTDVSGSTVGIIGLGRIGLTYARMMKFGFGCKIVYAGPSEKPDHVAELGGDVEYLSLDELLKRSDIVSVHVPLTDATRHSLNAECFAKMKPTAVLINTSRGAVVDQDALDEALRSQRIAAAGLDVTTPEPLPTNHPLFQLPNCVILPHIGSATIKTRHSMADIAVENLLAGISDKPLSHAVV